ncbi:LysR family transcriptional regulator [Thalassovita mediterranea]|jgi:DNA-binding transcriptional LysR family regulator|uniref:HTH-type transcriptional activator CmpR n=1 Tax=Thalassovita mediterranea TaxID=340021 RepID=A0A0P1GM10_9RHOB|nr:LysR family transcriptional regulator [Thalassovita mediterranea]CUH83198.1 HTH-type transcriptional activator CmpR [Thalassovita mediterranea]SIS33483.1 DNA-binding transcriptional regulator, LysR family [Thalassovita mediterranea]
MTLDQIRIFLAVAERGHVTRAAEALNMTQSAVSAAIATLEATYDVRLFDRVGRGIALTQAGHDFTPQARALLQEAAMTKQALADLSQEIRGRLRIQASQTVASYWLPPRLMRLHSLHPGVQIDLAVGNTAQAAEAVSAGTADLGFVEGALPDSDLHRRVVARDELVLVMARDHPMARAARFEAQDYVQMQWILRESGSGTRSETELHLAEMGLSAANLDVALELPSNEAVLAAVAAGPQVTMLSARAVGAAKGRGLAMRRVTWAPHPARVFAVLTHPKRYQSRAVRALLDLL